MQTYTPIRGMIVCNGGTGDYVKKADHEAEVARLKEWNAKRAGLFACTEQRLASEIAHLREDTKSK